MSTMSFFSRVTTTAPAVGRRSCLHMYYNQSKYHAWRSVQKLGKREGRTNVSLDREVSESRESVGTNTEEPTANGTGNGQEEREGTRDGQEEREGIGRVHGKNAKTALLRAQKLSSVPIEETEKPISTYMTLPASQYSVLDARKIERIDEDTFICYVGGINFLGVRVEPVLTLSVIVGERGPTVRMLEVRLEGSTAAEKVNEQFSATMENIVEWRDGEQGEKFICSTTTLEIVAQVPGWFVFPVHMVETTGSKIMQKVLDTAVPRFLAQLEQDYVKWSVGEERTID